MPKIKNRVRLNEPNPFCNYLLETISCSRISRGVSSGHNGIDFATGEGNNPAIYSPFSGKVVQSAHDSNRKICTNNNMIL